MTSFRFTRPALLAALLLAPLLAVAQPSAPAAAPSASAATAPARACPPAPREPSAADLPALMARARDRGLLWRLERDGRVSHLYGSLHVGQYEWLMPGPRLAAALRGSRVLALELDITDPATQQALVQGPPEGLTAVAMTDSQRERLKRQIDRACMPAAGMGLLHPVMQVATLATQAARWDGLFAQFGSELMLITLARAGQLQVVPLESAWDQLRALVPTDAAKARRLFEQGLRDLEDDQSRPQLRRLAAAWEAGRLEELADYPNWCDCIRDDDDAALMKRLLDGRNPHLADKLDELDRTGVPFLAAVGALHMIGPQGLPSLLQKRGFKVELVGR